MVISWLLRKRIWNLKPHTKCLVANYLGLHCKLLTEASFTQVRNCTSKSQLGLIYSQWLTQLAQNSILMQNHNQVNELEDFFLKKDLKIKGVGSPLRGEMPSAECSKHARLAFYLSCTYTLQQKAGLGNYCVFGTWDKKPTQCSLTQCKSRHISQLGSCQSLQGEAGVVPWPHCLPAFRCQLSLPRSVQLSVLAPRAVGARGTNLPSEPGVTCASSSGDPATVFCFYSALVFHSILIKQNTKPFSLLRESKWSANVFALLHEVQQCVWSLFLCSL